MGRLPLPVPSSPSRLRILIGPILGAVAACGAPDETVRSVDADPTSFTRFDLRMDAGDVTLIPGDEAHVEATLQWRGDIAPELESRLAGGTLLVSLTCPQGTRACGGSVDIVLPIATEIDLVNRDGAVRVEGFEGPLDLSVDSGSVVLVGTHGGARVDVDAGTVTLEDTVGRFDVATGSGDIRGSGLTAPIAEAVSARGAVELSFETAPDLADVTTNGGDIRLAVPQGEYDVDATSRRGTISVDGITNTSNAASVLLARSTAGDITVTAR